MDNKIINIDTAQSATENTEYLNNIMNLINTRFAQELEHAQGRSNFQIEKFIAMNDFTISSVYKHVLKNAAIMRREFFRVIKEGIEYQREFELRWSGDKSKPVKWPTRDGKEKFHWYDLDVMDQKLYLQDLAISIKDKVQQLQFFDSILDTLESRNGGPITKEQFDREEPVYWERRFKKQIGDEITNRITGVSGGNLESVRNAMAPTILENSVNQIAHMPDFKLLFENPMAFLIQAQESVGQTYGELSSQTPAPLIAKNSETVNSDVFGRDSRTLEQLGISIKTEK